MTKKIMISHATADIELARRFADAISRTTLRQVSPWFSSDQTAFGGMQLGEEWFRRIVSELNEASAVIVLVTPASQLSPWVLFEAGFAAGREGVSLVPVLVGAEAEDVPKPLRHWQIFRPDSFERCEELFAKLAKLYEIHFDNELVAPILRDLAKYCGDWGGDAGRARTKSTGVQGQGTGELSDAILGFRSLLEAKFFDLHRFLLFKEANFVDYKIRIKNPEQTQPIEVTIDIHSTVGNVMDAVYHWLAGRVSAFSYLEEWILVDDTTGLDIVIRNVADEIPAHTVFPEGRVVKVEMLASPYDPAARKFKRSKGRLPR